ncbi:MAG: hypothetical protein VB858_09010 [Planctomycetaceae bacterium]
MRTLLTLSAAALLLFPTVGLQAEDEKKEEDKGVKVTLTDADKAALGKVRDSGGSTLQVAQNDERIDVAFHLADGDIGNDHLKPLQGLTFVHSLNLRGTQVDDRGLPHIAGSTGLVRLHLEKTKVTDAGIDQLKKLEKLEYLNLYGTGLTDAGLDSIASLKGLKKVYVWQTKVTIDGVAKLKKTRPDLKIIPDLVEDKIRAEKEAVRKAEEAKQKAEEEAKKKAEAEAKKKAEADKKKAEADAKEKTAAEKKAADKESPDDKKE